MNKLRIILPVLILAMAALARGGQLRISGCALPATSGSAIVHVFAGEPAGLDLTFTGEAKGDCELHASLYQTADSLAAPIAKDLLLAQHVSVSEPLRVTLPIPAVTRDTQLRATFILRGDRAAAAPFAVTLFVHPRKQMDDELRALLGARAIHIFGQGEALRKYLQARHIAYTDAGSGAPDAMDPGCLYIGHGDTALAQDLAIRAKESNASVILFVSEPGSMPAVYADIASHFTKVTLPVERGLESDPLCQQNFLNILQNTP